MLVEEDEKIWTPPVSKQNGDRIRLVRAKR
jgi:hypothetical protein